MKGKLLSHGLAVLLMIIWGLSYLSIKVVVMEVEPTLLAFYRFFIASVILFVIHKIKYPKEKILREDKLKVALGGLFGVSLYFFFENYSVAFTSASNVAILISSIPIFTLISQRVIFKEKLSLAKAIGALFSVIGIAIIIGSKERISLFSTGSIGDFMALSAAICWVIYNVVISKLKGNYKSITITTYQSIWGTLFLAPSLFFNPIKLPSNTVIINIIYLSIFCSCIGYIIYIYCLERLGATAITTYINVQPIISLAAAVVILNESVSIFQISGCLIILLGVFMVSFGEKINLDKFKSMV